MDNHQNNHDFDEQFNELPLPDADKSWQKMKELLEEKDDRRPVVPFSLASCAGWGLALLVAGGLALYFLKPQKWFESASNVNSDYKTETQKEFNKNDRARSVDNGSSNDIVTSSKSESGATQIPSEGGDALPAPQVKNDGTTGEKKTQGTGSHTENTGVSPAASNRQLRERTAGKQQLGKTKSNPDRAAFTKSGSGLQGGLPAATGTAGVSGQGKNPSTTPTIGGQHVKDSLIQSGASPLPEASRHTGTASETLQPPVVEKSTEPSSPADSAKKNRVADSVITEVVKKKENATKRKWTISAGIGEQQQIAMGAQRAVATTSTGRTNTFRDYIPSVYLRLERNNKWFLQSEFRYGAPQMLKEFAYSKQTTLSNVSVVNTTTYRLKKTYYHQFPVSFNYYLGRKFSVGAGAIFNRFYGAVSEREVISEDVFTQQVTTSKEVVRIDHFTDSFLYKTQTNLLFQAGYHWKAFTFSLRYTGDVQPFMKYTRPDGVINVRKNATLQFVAQLRLWQRPKAVVKKITAPN